MPAACSMPIGHALIASSSPADALPDTAACARDSLARPSYPNDDAWTAIVLFLSNSIVASRLSISGNFATWDEHLLGAREIVTIFYPIGEPKSLRAGLIDALKLQPCDLPMMDGCERWSTARGNSALTCAIAVDAPAVYGGSLPGARQTSLEALKKERGVPSAFGCDSTGEYPLATKWYSLPMLVQPLLSRFDYWAKVDVDVCLRQRIRLSTELVKSGSWFMHTRLQQDNQMCERGLGDFMSSYTSKHTCCGTTEALKWRTEGPYPLVAYSNFVAGWLGYWQSDQVLFFAKKWHGWEGGWVHRWTDQQFWMPALRVTNVSEDRIKLWSHLRYHAFEHTKASENACAVPHQALRNASAGARRKVIGPNGRWQFQE